MTAAVSRLTLQREVFRELLNASLHFGPPPPPGSLGIGRFGAHDYPPSTYCTRGGVRVVMRIQLVDVVRGRRRADRGHGESDQSGAGGAGRGMMGWVPGSVERGRLAIRAAGSTGWAAGPRGGT